MGNKRGVANTNWRGERAGIKAMHARARQYIASSCEDCGGSPVDAALRKEAVIRLFDEKYGRWYSTEVADYMALCRSCHQSYDRSAQAKCHPDRKHYARGYCNSCYSTHIYRPARRSRENAMR